MSTQSIVHILVIRTGAIGDTILMSVVYQALRQQYPHAYIEAIGAVERLELINPPSLIDKITSSEFPGFSTLFVENAQLSPQIIAYFQRFDLILVYSRDPENRLVNNLCKICAQRVYRFDPFPPEDANLHITAYLLNTLKTIGITAQGLMPEIALPKNGSSFPGIVQPRITIHPGSGSLEKNWGVGKFIEVSQRIIEQYHAILLLIAGPAEEASVYEITASLPENAVILLDNRPLLEIAQELQRCRLYLGNDSGISHLAAAVGIPTIALFGPSNHQVWRPIGRQVVVLSDGSRRPYCQGISVEQVFIETARFLENERLYC